jgi:cell wall assembly regulator SMI1
MDRSISTSGSVEHEWARIVDWLTDNAPHTAAALNPPASDEDIAAAGAALGGDLPADLVAWWRCVDGTSAMTQIVPFLYDPLAIRAALSSRQIWLEVMEDFHAPADLAWLSAQPAGSVADAFVPEFLPIAADHGGCDLVVDLRPGSRWGCVREYDKVAAGEAEPLWDSVTAMLGDVAGALDNGTSACLDHDAAMRARGFDTVGGYVAVIEDGHLSWEPPSGW